MDCKLKCACGQVSTRLSLNLWNITFTCDRCGNRVPIAAGLINFYQLQAKKKEVVGAMGILEGIKERDMKPEKSALTLARCIKYLVKAGVPA